MPQAVQKVLAVKLVLQEKPGLTVVLALVITTLLALVAAVVVAAVATRLLQSVKVVTAALAVAAAVK